MSQDHISDGLIVFVSFVAFFKPADDCHHITGQAVTEEEQEEDERRLPVDEQQYQHGQYHAHKRHLAADVDFFEAPKRNLHNHGNTGKQGNAQCPPMHAGEAFDAVVDPNQADNQRSGGRVGTPINQRLSTFPMSVLNSAKRRAAQAQ